MKYLYLTAMAMLLALFSFAAPGPITGNATVCEGYSTTLSNTTTGGTWASSNTVVATVGITTGVVTGASGGSAVITYSAGGSFVTITVTVNPQPVVYTITGGGAYCAGGAGISIGLSGSEVGVSYQLYVGSTATGSPVAGTGAPLDFGLQTAAGVYAVAATNVVTSCVSGMAGSVTVAINPLPVISGPSFLCTGATITLSSGTPGGSWTSSNPAIAMLDPITGVASGVSSGSATVTYSLGAGCDATALLYVDPSPVISGPSAICVGSSVMLSATIAGGTWASSNTAVATIGSGSGMFSGVSPGATTIDYYAGGCLATTTISVNAMPLITGPSSICPGSSITLSTTATGGAWSSSSTSIVTVSTSGVVTSGVGYGSTIVSYTVPGCSAQHTVSVVPAPTINISASPGGTVCAGDTVQAVVAATGMSGNSYQWYLNTTAIIGATSDTIVSHTLSPGDSLSCMITGISTCSSAMATLTDNVAIIINPVPAITVSSVANCGGAYTLTATGAATYSWSPAVGLSCPTCLVTDVNPSATTTYMVTGTTSGCSGTANVTVNGNRISGHITYSGGVATDSFRVWLINYNPLDSQIVALDSTVSCMSGGTPYYRFDNPAAGSYMVKAKLFGTVPGTSGYLPTYGLSGSVWNVAATITHTAATDTQHINMLYGTVPSGPGFISGNVYSGAGKGTTGEAPVENMIVYLKNTASGTLTYTYTDAMGAYSFGSLAYGDYYIYPEEFDYYTTPSAIITLSAATPSVTGVYFKQHTDYGTITPFFITTGINTISNHSGISLFPNPTAGNFIIQWKGQVVENAGLTLSDMLGREVYKTAININAVNGQTEISVPELESGFYLITVKSANIYFSDKLMIRK